MTLLRSVGRWLYAYRWLVFIGLAVAAFVLGWIGFDRYYDTHPDAGSGLERDAAYSSLKLFLWNGPDYQRIPWQLEVARFLAGFVASSAALSAVMALFRNQLQQTRIRFMSGHVVVCGLGYVGSLFLRELRDQGVRAVVIESDPTNPRLDLCRAWRIPVILGEAQLQRSLITAGVQRASGLLAVCPEDAVNTEIVAVARQLAEESRQQPARLPANPGELLTLPATLQRRDLSCLARIGDPDLCRLLRIQETDLRNPSSSLVFFNTDEISARFLLDEYGIDPDESGHPHILVSNLESLGEWLVIRAALTWYWLGPESKGSLFITVVDEQAEDRVRALLDQHPDLDGICQFIYCSPSIRDLRALPELHAEQEAPAVTRVYVSAYRDEDALEIALRLRHELDASKLGQRPGSPLPMVVALSRPDGAARVIGEANRNGKLEAVKVFPALERTCTAELIEGGLHEPLAVALHNLWRTKEIAKGRRAPVWEELDESRKDSSRAQARDIVPKLLRIQCDIAPLRHWGAAKFEFEPEEVELLAAAEHQRWWDERVAAGWRKGERDAEKKTSPYLVPYEELDDEVAEYDRMFVREIPTVLALAGLQVIRVPALAGAN
ncbi:MAG: hypothetical protein QOH57_1621 [Mycobacterium sp.]|jgi:hypothetical protein|nr:hypothetical protein [Mycobacterium sp.]